MNDGIAQPMSNSDHEAARRLKLPTPIWWTVSEAEEAQNCIGCTARYESDMRVVDVVPGCPSHEGSHA